ncbi:pentatricopeptide repeat-containing protein At5g13770, chloroplastic [Diospyros lotus]|uniref:pentatricopeptide repeat-containing protein At5g13770, chloroplastic n=1 Tax=Diospyros lotus TaxID=55363 RepID=UPI002253B978|nr:pentatricopeptide repeat-containing protein At5g13770, chloroplastic [Diospyros lotus]
MAIAGAPSPDCSSSLASFANSKNNKKPPPPLLIPSSKLLSFLSFQSSRSFILSAVSASASAAGCHSPVLQEDKPSSDHPPLPPPAVLGFQEFQHDFTAFPVDDPNCLNGFISAMFGDPQTQELAFKYYEKSKLIKPEFRPTKSTLNHLARYLISSKNWTSVLSISEDFKSFRVLPDAYTCSRLVTSCLRAKKFKLVNTLLEIFVSDDNHEIGVLPFDSAMKGYNKLHMYSSTIHVYCRMKSAPIALDPGCYCRVMEAYMKTGDTEKVVALFQQFETLFGLNSKPICRKICRILCESLAKSGRPSEALEFSRSMAKKGIPLDHSIYSSLICAFASLREVKAAEELFEEAERKKMLRDPALFLKLVLMYIEEDLVEKSLEVVAGMKRVKIRVSDCIFSAIINGFSKRRSLRAAVDVYEEMVWQDHEPGQVTYASVINVYYRLGLYPKAKNVFSEMEKKGYDRCVVAYSNMVAIYGKSGRLREAMRLVAKMKEKGCEPNVWIYNSLLDMHGKVSNLRQVEKTWKEMKRRKIMPDKVSYTSIINAYNRAREFETCMKYYEEFRINGGVIDRAMAGIMVGIFSKTNQIDDLVKLLRDMKAEGTGLDGRLYRSALNALRDAGLQVQAKWLQQSFGMV